MVQAEHSAMQQFSAASGAGIDGYAVGDGASSALQEKTAARWAAV
jgi:hypothetical protein